MFYPVTNGSGSRNSLSLLSSRSWQENQEGLKAFFEAHGHTLVLPEEDQELYSWTMVQRRQSGELSPEQFAQLEKLGFDWDSKTRRDLRWERMYEQLRQFHQQHGHVIVPYGPEERQRLLALWVAAQRQHRARLSTNRLGKLNQLGFRWKEDISRQQQSRWDAQYQRLLRVYQQQGKCLMGVEEPYDQTFDNWVRAQQRLAHQLPEDRRQKLEAIGFPWQTSIWQGQQHAKQKQWENKYNQLVAFYREHRHCRVPFDTPAHRNLSMWMSRQRSRHERLSPDRRKKLEALPFSFREGSQKRARPWENTNPGRRVRV